MAVAVYSIPNCPKCAAVKALLKRNNVAFQEIGISGGITKELEAKLSAVGMEGWEIIAPVLDIGGTLLQGFEKEKILAALKEKGFLND